MRISDWSSDVCSSDLAPPAPPKVASVSVKQPTKADYAEVESQVFHNTEPGHNKFWSVSTNGSTLKTVYGKIGAGGATTEKVFSSPEAAQAAAAKLIKEIGRASCRERVCHTCRNRWEPCH